MECSDSIDNDGDGMTDLADSDCTSASDPFEGVGLLATTKLSDTAGYLSDPGSPGTDPGGRLIDGDHFGSAVEGIGDLDGDGIPDVAVGAYRDDTGGVDAGAIYILFLNADGTVKADQKIGEGVGGLLANLDADDRFGTDIALLGDVDGDGVQDLAVAASGDDDGATDAGALYILFLNTDGTVKAEQKISNLAGGLGALNDASDGFGNSPAGIGDFDEDGVPDLAVGSFTDNQAGGNTGSLYIMLLHADGTVRSTRKITEGVGGFTGNLTTSDRFGSGLAYLGDLDGDARPELAVGARFDGSNDAGVIYLLSLKVGGSVASHVVIEGGTNGFVGPTDSLDRFSRPARIGDLDGDGVGDLAVGAVTDDDGAVDAGAVWILFLNPDGSVHGERKISALPGLDASDFFGNLTAAGDIDGDGVIDLVAGADGDDDGGADRGAAYVLFMDGTAAVCGNGILDPLEECDDGNTVAGDLCSATCEAENSLVVRGEAAGGTISMNVAGNALNYATGAGETSDDVVTGLVAAIEAADPSLDASAELVPAHLRDRVKGDVLWVNGRISLVSESEPLLQTGRSIAVEQALLQQFVQLEPLAFAPTQFEAQKTSLGQALVTPGGRMELLAWTGGPYLYGSQSATPSPGTAVSASLALSPATFYEVGLQSGLAGTPILNGWHRICFLSTGPCGAGLGTLTIPAISIGLAATQTFTASLLTTVQFQVQHSPWTLGPAPAITGSYTATTTGFRHGPLSNTVSLGRPGAVLNWVSPTRVSRIGGSMQYPFITRLQIEYLPEPASFFGLAASALLLAWLGARSRRR